MNKREREIYLIGVIAINNCEAMLKDAKPTPAKHMQKVIEEAAELCKTVPWTTEDDRRAAENTLKQVNARAFNREAQVVTVYTNMLLGLLADAQERRHTHEQMAAMDRLERRVLQFHKYYDRALKGHPMAVDIAERAIRVWRYAV